VHLTCVLLIITEMCGITLDSQDAAHHYDVSTLMSLHIRQQFLHQSHQAKEVRVKEFLHSTYTLALQRPDHAHTGITHYKTERLSLSQAGCGRFFKAFCSV